MNVPALSINKVCLSGIDAIALADQLIRCRRVRDRRRRRHGVDDQRPAPAREEPRRLQVRQLSPCATTWTTTPCPTSSPTRAWAVSPSGQHRRRAVTREEQDAFSARSHQRAAKAWKDGYFDDEVVRCRSRSARATRSSSRPTRASAPTRRRVAGRAAPGLRQGRHDHRRLRLADLRRGLLPSSS
jgi:acetyl-CoA acetyltransferase